MPQDTAYPTSFVHERHQYDTSMESMMKTTIGILAVALVIPAVVDAQLPRVGTGARVRITVPKEGIHKYVTTVQAVREDSIEVAARGGSRILAIRDVTSLDISLGKRSRFFFLASAGLGAGVVTGGLIGAVAYQECRDCFFGPANRAQSALLGAVVVGTLGLAAGALLGAVVRVDEWERHDLFINPTIARSPFGGVTLGIVKAF